MGRYASQAGENKSFPRAEMFGAGEYRHFTESGVFTVPEGVTALRVTCRGGDGLLKAEAYSVSFFAGGTAACMGISATGGGISRVFRYSNAVSQFPLDDAEKKFIEEFCRAAGRGSGGIVTIQGGSCSHATGHLSVSCLSPRAPVLPLVLSSAPVPFGVTGGYAQGYRRVEPGQPVAVVVSQASVSVPEGCGASVYIEW